MNSPAKPKANRHTKRKKEYIHKQKEEVVLVLVLVGKKDRRTNKQSNKSQFNSKKVKTTPQ